MRGSLRDLTLNRDGTQNITVTVTDDFRPQFDKLQGKDLDVEIRLRRKRRSPDANAFCWALCSDIGKALSPPLSKEEVYRMAIRDVGEFETLFVRADAVEDFQRSWSSAGTGWFAEVLDDSVFSGFKQVAAYFGSSTYDTRQMSRLLDYLLEDARLLGISIPLGRNELDRLIGDWHMKRKEAEP